MLTIPKFNSEREEADWWYDNRHLLEEEFVKKIAAGEKPRTGRAKLFLEELQRKRDARKSEDMKSVSQRKAEILPKSA